MPEPNRRVIVGIYLSSEDKQPRFRQLCDDYKSARQDIATWLSHGYVNTDMDGGKQDHYPPAQIYKFRLMPATKIVTKPNTETDLPGISNEESYWVNESGKRIDPWSEPM